MKIKLPVGLLLFALTLTSSCNMYNPAEPIPSYIHIDNITVTIPIALQSSTEQGSASGKIADAWVYIDEQLIGCFQMPCTVPVLYDGNHTLKIRPGIKVNGIAATRSPYPFYAAYSQVINLERGKTSTVTNATVTYNSYMSHSHFPMIEDFESIGYLISSTPASETPFNFVSSPASSVFEGLKSGVGSLRSNNYTFECATKDSFLLNKSSAPVFLEFNYKCNHVFTVFLTGYTVVGSNITNTQQQQALTYNPSENWNKAYLYLTPTIGYLGSANYFRIYFGMKNYATEDSVGLALDNVKIVQ